MNFIECDTCRVKPGSPALCSSCYNNRRVIDDLTSKHKTFVKFLENMKLLLSGTFTANIPKDSTAGSIFVIMRSWITEMEAK